MVPLFLSVSLGLSAVATGVHIMPLSITLLLAAAGIPRFGPNANPRRIVRLELVAMFAGTVVLLAAIDQDASSKVVTVPLLLMGFGIGALASQLGAVAVSAVPTRKAPKSAACRTPRPTSARRGDRVAGSVLIASLTAILLTG